MRPKTIVILVLVVLAVVIVIQNSQIVTLQLFFWKIMMSRIIFIMSLLVVGFIIGFLVAKMTQKT